MLESLVYKLGLPFDEITRMDIGDFFYSELSILYVYGEENKEMNTNGNKWTKKVPYLDISCSLRKIPQVRIEFEKSEIDEKNIETKLGLDSLDTITDKLALQQKKLKSVVLPVKGKFLVSISEKDIAYIVTDEEYKNYIEQEKILRQDIEERIQITKQYIEDKNIDKAFQSLKTQRKMFLDYLQNGYTTLLNEYGNIILSMELDFAKIGEKYVNDIVNYFQTELIEKSEEDLFSQKGFENAKKLLHEYCRICNLFLEEYDKNTKVINELEIKDNIDAAKIIIDKIAIFDTVRENVYIGKRNLQKIKKEIEGPKKNKFKLSKLKPKKVEKNNLFNISEIEKNIKVYQSNLKCLEPFAECSNNYLVSAYRVYSSKVNEVLYEFKDLLKELSPKSKVLHDYIYLE